MKKKKRFWNGEKLLSISAILVSIGTFIVFAYQTNLIRKQQYMSVLPYLQFANYHNYSPKYKFVLTNKGIGPAIVTSTKISINGKTEEKDLATYLGKNINYLRDSIGFVTSSIYKGMIIAQNESIELVKLDSKNRINNSEKLLRMIHNDSLNFIIEYKSIYGEKWRINIKDFIPVKIDD
jgi:hypothetical protein